LGSLHQEVEGSNPSWPTSNFKGLDRYGLTPFFFQARQGRVCRVGLTHLDPIGIVRVGVDVDDGWAVFCGATTLLLAIGQSIY
jgi:hypothetical protein